MPRAPGGEAQYGGCRGYDTLCQIRMGARLDGESADRDLLLAPRFDLHSPSLTHARTHTHIQLIDLGSPSSLTPKRASIAPPLDHIPPR